jgi:hypothetical protein
MTFRFDSESHVYTIDGRRVPSITQMLKATGYIDDAWYSKESCDRGTAVHAATSSYDMQALTVAECDQAYRPWLVQHARAMAILNPEWIYIEVPFGHERLRFGGRPDRVGTIFGATAVCEVKSRGSNTRPSGDEELAHAVQLALQAILVAPTLRLEPRLVQRYAVYLSPDNFSVVHFHNTLDFQRANKVVEKCSHLSYE